MGFTTLDLPPVDPAAFTGIPYRERTRLLARDWVDHGFGTPQVATLVYIAKLIVFFVAGAALVATVTSGLDPLHPRVWWDDPIVWQKAVLWTVLLESVGVAGSWGPLAGHFKPMTGGIRYWARPGTIRLPPWPDRVPFTAGDERRPVDVALYLALLAALVVALLAPARARLGAPAALLPVIVLLGLIGLRDKVVFIAARSEQYIPALVFFALYPFVDMIVAAKLLIVTVWVGAAFSKLGRHFASVIPPMVSNTPWVFVRAVKRLHYRSYPEDLRPAPRAVALAHGAGTLVEMGTPFLLLFSQSHALTVAGVVLMLGFHTFIISTFPLAVPLEWNALFMYVCAFLFLGHPNQSGYGLGDMDPLLLVVT